VPELRSWLTRVGPEEGGKPLVGCALDDGDSLETALIVGLDWPAALLTEGGKRAMFSRLGRGIVLDERPGAPLLAAMEAARSPGERAEREERLALLREGIDPDKLTGGEARRAVLALLAALRTGAPPDYPVRHAAYSAFVAPGHPQLARTGAGVFREVVARFEAETGDVPDDCHWRVAKLLRSCKELTEAIAVSAVLHDGRIRSQVDRKLLATTRVAALIDLWELRHDKALLLEADRAFEIARAIGHDDEETKRVGYVLTNAQKRAGLRDR
jgi:hypothetical protein